MNKFTKQATDNFINILQEEETKCKIENNILNPIVAYIGKRLWPYIVSLSISLCLLLILLAYMMYVTFHLQKSIHLQDLKQ